VLQVGHDALHDAYRALSATKPCYDVRCQVISVVARSFVVSPVCHGDFACAGRAGQGEGDVPAGSAEGLLARAAAGPGFWEEWLGELRREGLIGELLADGVIAAAVAEAEHGHKLDRALTTEVTAICVITGVLFPDQAMT